MAWTKIKLENKMNGKVRFASIGYSCTALLFPIAPPIYRGDYKWALLVFLLNTPTLFIFPTFIFPFIYNKMYLKGLIKDGYKVSCEDEGLISKIESKAKLLLPRAKKD